MTLIIRLWWRPTLVLSQTLFAIDHMKGRSTSMIGAPKRLTTVRRMIQVTIRPFADHGSATKETTLTSLQIAMSICMHPVI